MIKMGQAADRSAGPIEPVGFAHPRHPQLGLEVITLAQLRRRVPPHHQRFHSRPDFHQLMLIEAGRMEHEVDFERYRCGQGSLLHVRPGQVQRFLRDAGSRGWVVLFTPDFVLPERTVESSLGIGEPAAFTVPAADLTALRPTLRTMAGLADRDGAGAESIPLLQHLLAALLLLMARARDAALGERPRQRTAASRVHDRFVRDLERHFASSRTTADYARRIGTSPKTLVRACQAVAGTAPKRLIERRVALEAKRLLAHSTQSVTAIGVQLGFSEPTNFVKFFRRCEATTPAAFRARFTVREAQG